MEGRVTVLHGIREDEELLDTWFAQTKSNEIESDTTCPWLRSPISGEPVLQKRNSVSTNDPWPRLGAKPKALISSTPLVPTQD